jgi:subtilisin family serine protease
VLSFTDMLRARTLPLAAAAMVAGTSLSAGPDLTEAQAVASRTAPLRRTAVPVSQQVAEAKARFMGLMPAPPADAPVCVIDTGVTVTDTVAHAIISRTSFEGQSPDDSMEIPGRHHGTEVAQMIAGVGQERFGIFPHAQIISVKANYRDQAGFSEASLRPSIDLCVRAGAKVINMSLSMQSDKLAEQTRDAVHSAISRDVSVVVAAGNEPNLPLSDFGNIPGVISVGGLDVAGGRCSSTAADVSISAFVCNVRAQPIGARDLRPTTGTSFAAPQVAATIAALRSYSPDLSARAAEEIVLASATRVPAGRRLNVRAAFQRANITIPDVLETPYTAMQAQKMTANIREALARPRVLVTNDGKTVRVGVLNTPDGAALVFSRGSRVIRRTRSNLVSFPLRTWRPVTVRFVRRGAAGPVNHIRHLPRPLGM